MDGYIGEIRLFAPNFAPRNWALCNGQLLSIAQNQALFSILNTFYGGNGITNFALPDLRGRAAVGWGNGQGLSPYTIGQKTGTPTTTLTENQLPPHKHLFGAFSLAANINTADKESPAGNYFANGSSINFDAQHDGVTMKPLTVTLGNTGNGDSYNNMMPYLAINYIICIAAGIYPSRI